MEKTNIKKWVSLTLVIIAIAMLTKYALKVLKKDDIQSF